MYIFIIIIIINFISILPKIRDIWAVYKKYKTVQYNKIQ